MSTQQQKRIHLLLAEVDATVRASMQYVLNRAGYDVTTAATEAEAIAALADTRLQLVLLGEAFAAKQQFAFCARLRCQSKLPIVILAQLEHPNDLILAFRSGVNDYIIEPLPLNVLLARLAAVLRRASANTYRLP